MQNVNEGHSGKRRKRGKLQASKDLGRYEVRRTTVDPLLWHYVHEAVRGTDRHIEVADATTVYLVNGQGVTRHV